MSEREVVQTLELRELLCGLAGMLFLFDELLVGSREGLLLVNAVSGNVLLFFVELLAPARGFGQMRLELLEACLLFCFFLS